MKFSRGLGRLATVTALSCSLAAATNAIDRFQSVRDDQLNRIEVQQAVANSNTTECTSTSCYRYYNPKTEPYFIKHFPDVDFATGEFYGGSVAINKSDPSRTLYFIFKPAIAAPVDEITVWLNGGPGCSSLIGFLQENGPFLWQPGVDRPQRNPYTWANTTNMLWVEQPVGTGYAQGKVTATGQVDIAIDFVGFFKNWQQLFGIKNYKIYVTGESYAGRYVPYISAQMLDQNDTTYFDLSGAIVYDPCIGDCDYVQMVIPSAQFAIENNAILNYNASTIQKWETMSSQCGFADYLDKYLQFPPPGNQPKSKESVPASCNPFKLINDAVAINPCFNIYHITDYCPFLANPLVDGNNTYFNRQDVKKAIHAPLDVTWAECTGPVFLHGEDNSPDSIISVLPQVIEATNRVIVGNADWDNLIYTNGTLLNIQNMTWNGHLGFQTAPSEDIFVNIPYHLANKNAPPQGSMGRQHYERGLLWVETYQSGHMQPQYQPRTTLLHLEWMLGRISSIPSS